MKYTYLTLLAAAFAIVPVAAQPNNWQRPDFPPMDWSRPDLRPPVVVGPNSGPVNLRVGQLLEVRLPVQAGTGYSWTAAPDAGPALQFIGQHTLHPFDGNMMMGGTQTQMFIYRAVQRGRGDVRMVYRRPWEGGIPPAKTVDIAVTVGPWLM